MSNKIWDEVKTSLDLNGPTLSIVTNPSDTTVCAGGSAIFTGLGTATFPAAVGATVDGTVNYQWFEKNEGALGVSTFWTGQDSEKLTLLHPESPSYNLNEYRFRITYTPSAYGNPATGAAKSTGNAINGEVFSDFATLTVLPTLEIQAGPSSVTSAVNQDATFNVVATVTDNSEINYQWQVDGNDVNDGTRETSSSATRFTNLYERTDMSNNQATIVIPDDATNVKIRVAGGAGGAGQAVQNGSAGSAGQGRSGTFTIADGGRTLDLFVGDRGKSGSGTGNGGDGANSEGGDGGDGDNGSASSYPANDGTASTNVPITGGQGGGGGAGVFVFDRSSSTTIISAGAGGGGGGGSENAGGNSGNIAGEWQTISGDVSASGNGGDGDNAGGQFGGGGGGGGAGGYRAGSGGSAGTNVAPPNPPPVVPPPVPEPPVPVPEPPVPVPEPPVPVPEPPVPVPEPPVPVPEPPVPEPPVPEPPIPVPEPPFPIPVPEPRAGCTDLRASNFSILATVDDGSCVYPPVPEPPVPEPPTPEPPPPIPSGPGPCIPYYQAGQDCPDSVLNPPPPPDDDDDGGPCFASGTLVTMRSKTLDLTDSGVGIGTTSTTVLIQKPISEIKVGDYVLNKNKTDENKVVFVEKITKTDCDIYSPTPDVEPFATKNHMLYKDGQWIVIDDFFPWLRELNCQSVTDPNIETFNEIDLYNLWLTGDGTYIVNGYGTHSIMFDGGWLRNSYEQGLLTHRQVMSTMMSFCVIDKPDQMQGAFLINKAIGKINIKLLNKLACWILCSDKSSRRRKSTEFVMRFLGRRFKK